MLVYGPTWLLGVYVRRRYISARRLFSVDTDDSSNATINARSQRRTNPTDLMLTCCLSAPNCWGPIYKISYDSLAII